MKFLDLLFKPAAYAAEIVDPNLIKKQYRYWRLRIFSGIYLGYVFYYFTRKSFTFAMPALIHDLGFSKSDLGILASILSISYGLSKFLSGVLSDRSNPRYFMATGLILTGICNILFGFSSTILFFAFFWGLNGWFQGWGWPPCARLLTHWYSQTERGTWWGMWNTSHSVGAAVIPLLVAYCVQCWGWRYGMYIPALLCMGVGIVIIYTLRDTPQSLGLPPIEKFKNDYPSQAGHRAEEHEISMREILFEHVLTNKYIWILAFAYFFVYVIRTAINDWSVLFLVETKGYSLLAASACIFTFEAGGICGSLFAGWASDKFFAGKRGPINVLFSVALIFAVMALWLAPQGAFWLFHSILFVIGFFVFGPQMLIGMAAAELSHKKAAGSATGFVGWLAALGSAAAGYPLGRIAEEYGWSGFFFVVAGCGGISALILLPLWGIKTHPQHMQANKPEVLAEEPTSD